MAFCVGLTGGIGCGKSSATDMFAALGAAVVDTDVISRELTGPGGAAMDRIAREFGAEYVLPDGSLDRARMRALVFGDADAKRRLEAILHPLIRETSRSRIADARAAYVLLVVPLLLETDSYRDLLNRVLVIDCDEARQVERVMARSSLRDDEVRSIMKAQLPRAERLARADDVLRNDADINHLRAQVEQLHARYLGHAKAQA
ncbi:MAG: dephospho-CoA kinase [Betaproteobacteria bacterium]|jgi:dephospho-CoA kinase|nr:dephospho-CoA kinase [Betaproteobacteria bacterium]